MTKVNSILFVTYHFPPEIGGIQTRILNYCDNLSKRGVEVAVLFPTKRRRRENAYLQKGALVIATPGKISYLGRNTAKIVMIVLSRRVDVVHVFTGASTALGFFALLIGRIFSTSTSLSIFGREDVSFGSRWSRLCFTLSVSIVNSITTNSEATSKYLPEGVRSKVRILLGGATVESQVSDDSKTRDMVILFVGRLAKRKGVDDLLKSFKLVQKSFPSAHLMIVGDGPEKENLLRLLDSLGLKNVTFAGTLWGTRLQEAYSRCTLCVLPSKSVKDDSATEGLGLTLIEASMHGKPLIGTRHGGIPEIVQDGVNGLLIPENDPFALSRAIVSLLSNASLREQMGNKAFEIAHEKFSWNAATQRLLDSYSWRT